MQPKTQIMQDVEVTSADRVHHQRSQILQIRAIQLAAALKFNDADQADL